MGGHSVAVVACLLGLLSGPAAAHRSLPPGVTCGSQFTEAATALEIPNPMISWASYRILTCDAPVFWLKAPNVAVDQPLYFTAIVPVLERFADVRLHVLLIGPGLPLPSEDPDLQAHVSAEVRDQIPDGHGAILFSSPHDQSNCSHLKSEMMADSSDVADGRCHFHEPYGDTHSWVLLDEAYTATAAGDFHFAVFSNDKPAKLSFACCDWPEDFTTAYPMPDAECPHCGTRASFAQYSSLFYETKGMADYGGFPPAVESCSSSSTPSAVAPDNATQCPPEGNDDGLPEAQPESCELHCAGEECHSHNIFGECTYSLDWITPRPLINGANVTSLILFKGDSVLFTSAGHFWPHNLAKMENEMKLNSCDFSSSNQILTVEEVLSGTAVTFNEEGTFYYSCEMTGHCALGQVLTIQIKDSTDGMRCHSHPWHAVAAGLSCSPPEVAAHVTGNPQYGATHDGLCSEFCTMEAGIAWITGGAVGDCASSGHTELVQEMTVQVPGMGGVMTAIDVIVRAEASAAESASFSCGGGTVAAHVIGNSDYGAAADQCAEMCTVEASMAWIPGAAAGTCASVGYTVKVAETSVQPAGSPIAMDVRVNAVPGDPDCHCHSYEEILCTAAGDDLYDEHIVELQNYCQGVVDGSDETCPYKCFQPWEVLHLYYLECDSRPVHELFTSVQATGKCHLASAAPAGAVCLDASSYMASSAPTGLDGGSTRAPTGLDGGSEAPTDNGDKEATDQAIGLSNGIGSYLLAVVLSILAAHA